MKMNRARILSLMLALMLIFSAAFSLSSCASGGDTPPDNNVTADNDPNMTAYDGQFTVIVDTSQTSLPTTVELQVVPADANYAPTYFSDEGAEGVDWGESAGITGGIVVESTYESIAIPIPETEEQYYSALEVTVPAGSGAGAASFLATNPLSSGTPKGYVNITLIVTDGANPDSISTTLSGNRYRIYTSTSVPADGTGYALAASFETLTARGNLDDRSYVTALDGMGSLGRLNPDDPSQYALWGGVLSNVIINGYLESLTINSEVYADGWQYRVYDKKSGPTDGEIVFGINNTSEGMGAGDYALSNDQLVVWAFDPTFGGIDFPPEITITVADEEQ
jgi:hypothetical protein